MIIAISASGLSGQPDGQAAMIPVDGYVILNNGDTLRGKVKWSMKYVENNPVEIRFTAENGATRTFDASGIRGFGNRLTIWDDDFDIPRENKVENYVSVKSLKKGVPVFMNRILEGPVIVYQNRSSTNISTSKAEVTSRLDGITFTYAPGEGLSIGPTYKTSYRIIESRTRFSSYFVSKQDGELIKVGKENYEALFPSLFGDCPAIAVEIEKNPDLLKFRNFMIIAEIYNQICR